MKKYKAFRRIMIFWTLFIGVGAVFGAACMLIAPNGDLLGLKGLLPYFQVLPFADLLFQNFIFPGISLLIVNGITNLTAFYFIMKNKRTGAYLSCIFGVTLMLWITIQFVIFEFNFMSTIYFIFGALQFVCGLVFIIITKQKDFRFDESSCKNIATNPKVLVAYFSRLGYTKMVAYKTANELGAELYEITTPERTAGFLGFAWLGRFGMHKFAMPVNEIKIDITAFHKVIIVTPVHVFTVSPPVKGFCEACKGKIRDAEYIAVHFRKDSDFLKVFDEMDKLLEVRAASRKSVVCKFGNIIRTTTV